MNSSPLPTENAVLPLIALDEVAIDYGAGSGLGPVSLQIRSGETVALLGPSGCGKSTMLRLMANLEVPQSGTITNQLGLGSTSLVFQAPTLAPWLTTVQNVALPLELRGQSHAKAIDHATQALKLVGLSTALDKRPHQLSGGMAMRASLARALATSPRLLLLDEPFAALDEITRRQLCDDVLRLWEQTRPTLVLVTHNVEEAVFMAERVIVLAGKPGRIFRDIATGHAGPKPAGWRAEPDFRRQVEMVSDLMLQAMS